jgi:hypothetical protein
MNTFSNWKKKHIRALVFCYSSSYLANAKYNLLSDVLEARLFQNVIDFIYVYDTFYVFIEKCQHFLWAIFPDNKRDGKLLGWS